MIVCPACKNDLYQKDKVFFCTNNLCSHSKEENSYNQFAEKPLLISFDNTDTVCLPDFYKDEKYRVIKRRNPNILKVFYSIVYGASSETKKNIDILIDYLKIKESSKILIIGGGTEGHSIDKLLENNKSSITSIDIYPSDKTDYICDAHFLPFKNKIFDAVIIQAVLEHVLSPPDVVSEIHRVLKEDGIVYAETSFLQHVHEKEYDFTRYTPNGHRYLFKSFKAISFGTIRGPITVLAWTIRNLFESIFRSIYIGKIISIPFFILANIFDRFLKNNHSILGSGAVYFLGIKENGYFLKANNAKKTYLKIDKY
jgi:ubiquinone/menaquinone biosynthesis C-methylase UbiE